MAQLVSLVVPVFNEEEVLPLLCTELIVRARKAGYKPVDVGVPHYPRTAGQATGANPRVVARAFGELWRFRRDLHSINGLKPPG